MSDAKMPNCKSIYVVTAWQWDIPEEFPMSATFRGSEKCFSQWVSRLEKIDGWPFDPQVSKRCSLFMFEESRFAGMRCELKKKAVGVPLYEVTDND